MRAATTADIIVVGAGVFGAWTARALQQAGRRVTLVDAWGPANARAASGGETRMTRGSYGAVDECGRHQDPGSEPGHGAEQKIAPADV